MYDLSNSKFSALNLMHAKVLALLDSKGELWHKNFPNLQTVKQKQNNRYLLEFFYELCRCENTLLNYHTHDTGNRGGLTL